MIVAIELVRDKASARALPLAGAARPERLSACARRAACCCGPIGNVVYFMPPYVITPEEIDLMVEVAREGIELATCD